jgi:hypothetical protein
LPALIASYLQSASADDVPPLIEPLGPEAILTALPALSEIVAKQENLGIAPHLITLAEKQVPSQASVEALAAIAVNWAQEGEWSELAQRAYRRAREYARHLEFPEPVAVLPALAQAARALADRQGLQALLKQARDAHKAGYLPWTVDQAVVHIAAGLTVTGDTLKQEYVFDLPVLKVMQFDHYRALALAEMANAVEQISVGQLYRSSPRELFGMAGSFIEDKIEALIEQEQPETSSQSYWQAYAEESLHAYQTRLLNEALRILPRIRRSNDAPLPAAQNHQFAWPARVGQSQEIQETPSGAGLSAADALSSLITIFARHGRYDDVQRIVQATPYRSDLPVVVGTAVKELVAVGDAAKASALVEVLRNDREKAIANAYLAASLQPEQATILLKHCLAADWSEPTVTAVAESAAGLPGRKRQRIVNELLSQGRHRGRSGVLTALVALAPLSDCLMSLAEWRITVEQIIGTESWWGR